MVTRRPAAHHNRGRAGDASPTGPAVTFAGTVVVSSLAASAIVYPGITVGLIATLTGVPASVEFFAGATSLGTAAVSGTRARLAWTPLYTQWGAQSITAVATFGGGPTTSAAVSITVGPGAALIGGWRSAAGLLNGSGVSPSNGDAVASQADIGGTYPGSQGTAGQRPTYTASASKFGNNPCVTYTSASAQAMPIASVGAPFAGTDGATHTIIVSLAPSIAANSTVWSVQAGGANGNSRWLLSSTGQLRLAFVSDAAVSRTTTAGAMGSLSVGGQAQLFSAEYVAGTRVASSWLNGTLVKNTASALAAIGAVTPTNGGIGKNLAAGTESFNGDIEEVWTLSGTGLGARAMAESVMLTRRGSTAPGVGEYDTSAYGVHGFTTSGRYVGSNPGAVRTVAVLFRVDGGMGAAQALVSTYQSADGWEITLNTSGTVAITGPTGVVTVATVATSTGEIHGLVWTHDGSGNHTLNLDRTIPLSFSGATFTDTLANELCIGARSVSHDTVGAGIHILGVTISTTTVLSQAEAEQWFDDCHANQACMGFASGTTSRWDVKNQMSNLVTDLVWGAESGSDLLLYGALAVRESPAATQDWPWP